MKQQFGKLSRHAASFHTSQLERNNFKLSARTVDIGRLRISEEQILSRAKFLCKNSSRLPVSQANRWDNAFSEQRRRGKVPGSRLTSEVVSRTRGWLDTPLRDFLLAEINCLGRTFPVHPRCVPIVSQRQLCFPRVTRCVAISFVTSFSSFFFFLLERLVDALATTNRGKNETKRNEAK